MGRLSKAALLVLCLYAPLCANAEDIYNCTVDQKGVNGNWLAPQIVIGHDPAEPSGMVIDGIIQLFIGKPIIARVDVSNDKRITFKWVVKDTKDRANQHADMHYRATILRGSLQLVLSGHALNYMGPYTANGSCVLTRE